MKLTRSHQVLPTYAYCGAACGWYSSARPEGEISWDARAHARETGHETRVVSTTQVIFTPELTPAGTS